MKRVKSSYLFTGIFLIVLVLGAFMLPVLTLRIQDRQSMNDARYNFRTGLDYSIAYPEYEISLYSRMKSFAEGLKSGKTYNVVSSDYTGEEDEEELLHEVLSILEGFGVSMPASGVRTSNVQEYEEYQILDQKYYIIYDDELSNGVAFICRYIRLHINDYYELELLVDGRDNTVYYLGFRNLFFEKEKSYKMKTSVDLFHISYDFFGYYQADAWREESLSEFVADADKKAIEEIYNRERMHLILHYQEAELTLYRAISYEEDSVNTSVGIKEIKELILSN